jgi:eukaryotic-like serine/threonine-protein kinase
MPLLLAFAKKISHRALGRSMGATASRDDGDLLSFRSEASDAAPAIKQPRSAAHRKAVVVVSIATLLGLASAGVVYVASAGLQAARSAASPPPASGTAVLDSNPPGSVTVAGVVRGQTPLSLQLPAGTHDVTITAGQSTRTFSLDVAAGTITRQFIEFAVAPAPATLTGRLDVTSQPLGARVTVDGASRGNTPLSLADLAAGVHAVTISSGETTIRRSVTIRPGVTSSVDASIASPEAAAGWLALTSPVELTLSEDNQIVGTTRAARVMLPAGTHNLVLSNTALEFQTTMSVRIEGGKTMTRPVPLPTGLLSVNAVPWANVSVDGADIGTTPLANVVLPIGSHEVVWRHPQLGERRRTIAITARTPTRIGMDFKP